MTTDEYDRLGELHPRRLTVPYGSYSGKIDAQMKEISKCALAQTRATSLAYFI